MEISSRAEGGKGASGGGTRVHIYLPSGRRRIYAAIDSLGDFFILKWRRSYSLLSAKCSKDSWYVTCLYLAVANYMPANNEHRAMLSVT